MAAPLVASLPYRLHRRVAHARTANCAHLRQLDHRIRPPDAISAPVHALRGVYGGWVGHRPGICLVYLHVRTGSVCTLIPDVFVWLVLLESSGFVGFFLPYFLG